MKQIARNEFGGGLSEISLNKLIIKLIKRNIRIPAVSLKQKKMYQTRYIFFFIIYHL